MESWTLHSVRGVAKRPDSASAQSNPLRCARLIGAAVENVGKGERWCVGIRFFCVTYQRAPVSSL